ncbi:hypothetical protein ACIPJK_37505 [Streptomyces roseus]|uniref:hypothetical protein n=1 Tax=Streptomyces roseus TaxID=66430 RepID=UPI0038081F05
MTTTPALLVHSGKEPGVGPTRTAADVDSLDHPARHLRFRPTVDQGKADTDDQRAQQS